jgi:hypothetical protein
MRFALTATAICLATATVHAQTDVTVRVDLHAAKKKYDTGMAQLRERIKSEFAAREEKIRGAQNGLALLKAHAAEKEFFEDAGDLPLWMPTPVVNEKERLTRDFESAYQSAVRTLTKAREDKAAEDVQAQLVRFWEKRFEKIDFKAASIKDGTIHLPAHTTVATIDEHTGPIEVFAVARTAKENIRISAYNGLLIFNWEVNPREFRVHWPDKLKSETLSKGPITPLTPGTYYRIRWLIGPTGMTVLLNEQQVFSEAKPLAVDKMKGKVFILSYDDALDVKEFRVRRLVVAR